MIRCLKLPALLACMLYGTLASDAWGQGVQRYEPATPTLSPYLNLLGRQGVLPNYYSLVRPLQRQQQFNQQSLAFRQQQLITNQQLESQFAQPGAIAPTGAAGGFFVEGRTGSNFQNTRHFFPTPNYLNPNSAINRNSAFAR